MPQDLKEYLPDPRTLLEDSDRRAAQKKYQHALSEGAAGGPTAGRATPRNGSVATPGAAPEPDKRPSLSRVVAEPPPTTVPIVRPASHAMPSWKKTLIAIAAVVLPLVVFVVAWEWKNRGSERPASGPVGVEGVTTAEAPASASASTAPASSGAPTASAADPATTSAAAPPSATSVEPSGPASAAASARPKSSPKAPFAPPSPANPPASAVPGQAPSPPPAAPAAVLPTPKF